ncbi:MAG: metallophosphoesterase [Leptospiraceae bacterium]|nr:metallophosphoesterase [Leptospiraceae bacterium]
MLVIGDVHGCYKTLKALLKQFPNEEVCFVGDLIDKGPNSKSVVELVRDNGFLSVRGNHEEVLRKFINNQDNLWLNPNFGGDNTARNYGYYENVKIKSLTAAKTELGTLADIQWLTSLPLYLDFPNLVNGSGRRLFVTHSTVGKVWHYRDKLEQNEIYKHSFNDQALWGRPRQIIEIPKVFNAFGHTPVYSAVLRDHYVNLDSGCFMGKMKTEGYSTLSAILFPEMELVTQKFCE